MSEKTETIMVPMSSAEFITAINNPNVLFKMRLRFSLSISMNSINGLLTALGEPFMKPVAKDCQETTMEMTQPFVPDTEMIKKYAKTIKDGFTGGGRFTVEECRFVGYDYLIPMKVQDANEGGNNDANP